MSATILDGAAVAKKIRQYIGSLTLPKKPKLAVISFENFNAASDIYIRNKKKDCEECGIDFMPLPLSKDSTTARVVDWIETLNADDKVTGILLQLPVPKTVDAEEAIRHISPSKDVDGLTLTHQGALLKNLSGGFHTKPCTPYGVMVLLKAYGISVEGKHCVVVGRSNIVGRPLAAMLLNANATVTVCHSYTQDLSKYTQTADILISAVGKPNFITADMVKPDSVVIDVGINRLENGKLCGDVDFNSVREICSYITPVPGGVGLMTRAMLMWNCVLCANPERNPVIFEPSNARHKFDL